MLAIIALGLFLWLPLLTVEVGEYSNSAQGFEIGHSVPVSGQPYIVFFNAILAGTAIGFTLIAVFLYKKRSLQMLFCWFAVVFITAALAFVFYKFQTRVFAGDVVLRKWNLLAVAAIVLEILAVFYIRKDEETIRSLDRLR